MPETIAEARCGFLPVVRNGVSIHVNRGLGASREELCLDQRVELLGLGLVGRLVRETK